MQQSNTRKPSSQKSNGGGFSFSYIEKDIKAQAKRHHEVWKPIIESKKYQKLENAYYQIAPRGVVFFDVMNQELFLDQTEQNFNELAENHELGIVKRWNDQEIERMFGKGLNPTSLITSYETAQWFADEIDMSGDAIILELGTGAGWSSVMLYDSLQAKYPKKRFTQFSMDMSPHAVAATKTLLNYKNIPYVVACNNEELDQVKAWLKDTQQGRDFSGMILLLFNINEIMARFPEGSVNGVYSTHGTAYLSKNEYTKLLQSLPEKMKPGGIFIADSLNPLYTNKLDKKMTLSQMMFPNMVRKSLTKKGVEYVYGGKIANNSKYFVGQDVQVLKGFNTPHAYLIFEWCNYLVRSFDFGRLMKTIKSLEVTMKVVDEYRSDVFPSFLLKDIVSEEGIKLQSLPNAPEFPIFMDTQGFRVKL